jgi:hypothetical protein
LCQGIFGTLLHPRWLLFGRFSVVCLSEQERGVLGLVPELVLVLMLVLELELELVLEQEQVLVLALVLERELVLVLVLVLTLEPEQEPVLALKLDLVLVLVLGPVLVLTSLGIATGASVLEGLAVLAVLLESLGSVWLAVLVVLARMEAVRSHLLEPIHLHSNIQ